MMHSVSEFRIDMRHLVPRFVHNLRGTTAVEFAFIGPLFFALVFSALELGLVLTKMTLLDTAADQVSREIYIGRTAKELVSSDDLKERICRTVSSVVLDCETNLTLELTPLVDFLSIPETDAQCAEPGTEDIPETAFNSGTANSIMFMRICLTTKILTPGIGYAFSFAETGSQHYQIVSSLAFMNEPF